MRFLIAVTVLLYWLFYVGILGGVVYVAAHFISKIW